MSNKIVPQIYRAIIDDVIAAIEPEFTAHGVERSHLEELQSLWEKKVVESHVADFETPPQPPPSGPQRHYPHHYPSHVMDNPQHQHQHPSHQVHPGYATYIPPPPPHPTQVKAEPIDTRYTLATNISYAIPSLPGPQRPPALPMPAGVYAVPMPLGGIARPTYVPMPQSTASPTNNQSQNRIPQVDGPSSSASESPSPPPNQAPRASHPSLPQPPQAPDAKPSVDTEEINSDLDDSDTDGEEEDQEGTLGEVDTVLCTYDKVARVKNKWKCVLKDGMIHVNNKDYLFAKCTCEFEW